MLGHRLEGGGPIVKGHLAQSRTALLAPMTYGCGEIQACAAHLADHLTADGVIQGNPGSITVAPLTRHIAL